MNFSWARTVRRNLWVFTPGELLITLLLSVFFLLALGALLSGRPDAGKAFFTASLYGVIWLAWMVYVPHRQVPPWGPLGLFKETLPWVGLLLCYGQMKALGPVLHPQMFDAFQNGILSGPMSRDPSLWQVTLKFHSILASLFCVFYLSLFAWLIGLWAYHFFLRRALYQRFMLGLILVFAGGFLGFSLFPSFSPRFFHPQEWSWLEGAVFFQMTQIFSTQAVTSAYSFPGLHGALTAYLLFWQMAHDRRSLVWGVPLAIGIWLSTLLLGFHYFPDLLSGLLLAAACAWLAPRLEQLAGIWRRSQQAPLVWLSNLTEGYGEEYGKLAGRLGFLQSLGAENSPGLLAGGAPRNRSEEPLRRALGDLGGGPFWVRPSDVSGFKRDTLSALKPLSLERVIRLVFDSSSKRHIIIQKALKVSAMGVCRCFPPQDISLSDVEIRMTTLPGGQALLLRLTANKTFLKGWLEAPWSYFPPSFPLRGFELFDLVKLTRRLAARWGRFTELEWVLSGGKVFVLDGRPVRGESPATNEPE